MHKAVKRASLGGTLIGGGIVVGFGLSWMLAGRDKSGKDTFVEPEQLHQRRTAVYTFGYNQYGQLAQGSEKDVFEPKAINFDGKVRLVKASSKTSAVVTEQGQVFIAGNGMDARLGLGIAMPPYSSPNQPALVQMQLPRAVVDLTLGEVGGGAVDADGCLHTWGRDFYGSNGTENRTPGYPEQVEHPVKVVQVARGRQHLVFLDETGSMFSSGAGREGALGLADFNNALKPTRIPMQRKVVQVACGRDQSFAIDEDFKLYAWGADEFGSLGLGLATRKVAQPTLVASLGGCQIKQVAAGDGFTAALSSEGEVYVTGRGGEGQLATGQRDDNSYFSKIRTLPGKAAKVACGGGHVVALLEDGRLFVWVSEIDGDDDDDSLMCVSQGRGRNVSGLHQNMIRC